MVRIDRTTDLITDDFTLDDDVDGKEVKLNGVLKLTDESDDGPIYLSIGAQQLGYIDRAALIEFAEAIIAEWKPVESVQFNKEAKKQ